MSRLTLICTTYTTLKVVVPAMQLLFQKSLSIHQQKAFSKSSKFILIQNIRDQEHQ